MQVADGVVQFVAHHQPAQPLRLYAEQPGGILDADQTAIVSKIARVYRLDFSRQSRSLLISWLKVQVLHGPPLTRASF
jgi:hypothetical protein